jgi:hypothetical protein
MLGRKQIVNRLDARNDVIRRTRRCDELGVHTHQTSLYTLKETGMGRGL